MYLGIPSPHLAPNWAALAERARPVIPFVGAVFVWTVAIALISGRLARRGFDAMRPGLARLCFDLASALDPGILYPDQPEPPAPSVPQRRRRSRRTRP